MVVTGESVEASIEAGGILEFEMGVAGVERCDRSVECCGVAQSRIFLSGDEG
jgi:hypothetical protein